MAKRSRSADPGAADAADIVPTTTQPQKRRRVQPAQPKASGPPWYRGATPWDDLSHAEQADCKEAAANSVKFWDGPSIDG